MSQKRDYYDILGVAKDADAKALKSAYRKLAMKYHPDQNRDDPEAEAKFKELSEAYAILSDPQKRAAYDRMGHAAFGQGGGMGGGPGGFQDFGDIFSQVFGSAFGDAFRRGRGPAKGADLRYELEISLEDAYGGKDVEITVPVNEPCERCDGKGAEPGASVETCGTCGGAGRVRTQQGFFTMERTCPRCGGQGKFVTEPCKSCDGAGQVRDERTLNVTIPAGVEDGTRIRLAGEGDAAKGGGQRGDLYLFISVEPHDLFERDGTNLFCRAPVPMTTAALGGEVEIPTICGGRTSMKIPAGSQTGRRMRLRGKGMTSLRSAGRGDMYVELFVETPQKLSARQKELLEEFCELSGGDCHPESNGFFTKAKNFWDNITAAD